MSIIRQVFVSSGFTIFLTFSLLLVTDNDVFAIEFSNYTSEKFEIEFEYPSDWNIEEKTSRFDSNPSISISKPGTIGMMVILFDKDHKSSDIEELTNSEFKQYTIPGLESKVIESPSFLTIDGEKAGTYLFTMGNNIIATQNWHVYNGNDKYSFGFLASPTEFDSPENIEIRDHFIKSIKFLGDSELGIEPQQKSRFD
jgi:hypothetical protein